MDTDKLEDITCEECVHEYDCPVMHSRGNAACLTIRKKDESEPYILRKYKAYIMQVDDEDMETYFARLKRFKDAITGTILYQYYRFTHPEEEEIVFPVHPNSVIKVRFY